MSRVGINRKGTNLGSCALSLGLKGGAYLHEVLQCTSAWRMLVELCLSSSACTTAQAQQSAYWQIGLPRNLACYAPMCILVLGSPWICLQVAGFSFRIIVQDKLGPCLQLHDGRALKGGFCPASAGSGLQPCLLLQGMECVTVQDVAGNLSVRLSLLHGSRCIGRFWRMPW